MLTLRSTARLRKRLGIVVMAPANAPAAASTTRLGDLYANLVHVGRTQLVLAMSERTFLPVLVPAAPIASLIPRLRVGVAEMLGALRLPKVDIDSEMVAMEHIVVAATINRQVTGMMVDFAKALEFYMDDKTSLLDVSLKLARTPCSPLFKTTVSPDRATFAMFASTPADR